MAAFSIVITPAGIQALGDSGTLTNLPLPTGITLLPGKRARTAALNGRIIIVGATSAPIWLGEDLVLRALVMPTPNSAPTLAQGAVGTYTGTRRAKVSFTLRNGNGALIAEGPLSQASLPVTVTAHAIDYSGIPTPPVGAPVSGRRIYLTTNGGATYFAAADINDTTTTTGTDQTADSALSLIAADPNLVSAPADLDLIVVWKNRVFGRTNIDTVAGTSVGLTDRWPNAFVIDPRGTDVIGITGFLPRRDELAIGRRHAVWKLTGDSETNFTLVNVSQGRGILAPDTCRVINNLGYFLSDDGVYLWDGDAITSLTDETVRPWFTTDTYFNRAYFAQAFAEYDPIRHRYVLWLPAAGATVFNRWVELDILTGRWFGPHLSSAVTSWFSAAIAPDANDVLRLIVGADDGFLYAFVPGSSTDGPSTAIDFDITGKPHAGDPPDPDKTRVWLRPSVFTKKESGGTLVVTPSIGDITAAAGTAQNAALNVERSVLARLGVGRLCTMRFRENTAGQPVSIYGYTLPHVTLGRR